MPVGVIRVRFHGRGGQGMKTASRIVGTAALLDGYEAQDSPLYGAERRGAPMTAHVRLARGPILERGLIAHPDLVAVADETLLDEPAARPLAGLRPGGGLLVATPQSAETVRRHTRHPGPVVARDLLGLALEHVGTAAGGSTAMGAAVASLLGVGEAAVVEAVRLELEAIGLGPEARVANVELAARARAGLSALNLAGGRPEVPAGRLVDLPYAPPEIAAPTVTAPANTPARRTGSWRLFRPVIELERCTRCWICFVRCPEGAVELDRDDWPHIAYDVCKGCLICVEECPTHAIRRLPECRAWSEAEGAPAGGLP